MPRILDEITIKKSLEEGVFVFFDFENSFLYNDYMEINEKNLEKILVKQRKEYERHIGALAEDFTDQLKMIAESVSGIQQQLVVLREMVAKNTEDIEIIKIDIGLMKRELRRKVDIDEFELLEKRVIFLERKLKHA